MKKILLLCILTTFAVAGTKVRLWDNEADDLDIKSKNMGTYTIDCSSITATQIRPLNTDRKGILIYNDGGYIVYLSSYAATATTALYPIVIGGEYKETGIQCYTGVWYGIGAGTVTVKVLEKW